MLLLQDQTVSTVQHVVFLMVVLTIFCLFRLLRFTSADRFCNDKQSHGQNDNDRDAVALEIRFSRLYFVSMHLNLATLALAYYSIATLRHQNPIFDSSSYYHGPIAVIEETWYYTDGRHTQVVGYGGSWACPNNNNNDMIWCVCEVDSEFSCTSKDGDNNDDLYNNNYPDPQKLLESPFYAAWTVEAFVDCNNECNITVDRVSILKYVILESAVSCVLIIGVAWFLERRLNASKSNENENRTDKEVELLSPTEKGFEGVAS